MNVYGTALRDVVTTSAVSSGVSGIPTDGPDYITMFGGDDVVRAGGGVDIILGGDGDDVLNGDGNDDHIVGDAGMDRIDGGDGFDTTSYGSSLQPVILFIANTANSTGDARGDQYFSIEQIEGSTYGDTFYASISQPLIFAGGQGDDQVVKTDNEYFDGGDGIDTVWYGGTAQGRLDFGTEIGRLFGNGVALATHEYGGSQLVANSARASSLLGGAGGETLWGGSQADNLAGEGGDDIMRPGGGADTMSGGTGNDQYVIDDTTQRVIEDTRSSTDTAWVAVNDWVVGDNVEISRLSGTATRLQGSGTHENLVANPLSASTMSGNSGNDVLWGSQFADTLDGGTGDDIFRGQGGADLYVGGFGNDQFVVLDAGAVIQEAAGQGYDTVWIGLAANTAFTLPAHVERGNLSGLANRVTGNESDNVLVGDAVASTLDGAGGDDTLFGSIFADTFGGGTGHDIIYAGGGADRFIYPGAGWGFDQISGFDRAAGAKLDFRGSGISFAQLTLTTGNGNGQAAFGDSAVLVYGVGTLTAADFLFG